MGIFSEKLVSAEIIDETQDTRKKASSSITRGIVGGALLGPAGMIGGALSGKNKTTFKTRFLLTYDSGRTQKVEVKDGSVLYNYYMDFVKKEK